MSVDMLVKWLPDVLKFISKSSKSAAEAGIKQTINRGKN
jgi:hypothetical protein